MFIFHGADDRVVGPSSDRNQAKQLLGTTHDFVYTELDKVGHGFPASVQVELFEFFEPRRRHDKKRKHAWPRSSFAGKVTKEESTYLGDPMAELEGAALDLKDRLGHIRLGGGRARAAADALAEEKPEGAVAGLAKALGNAGVPFDGRAYAARALGRIGDLAGVPALRKAVALPASKSQSMVAVACAEALAALKDAEGLAALGKGIEAWTGYYEDKVVNGGLSYSDWRRATHVLVALVRAWADLADPASSTTVLEKVLVQRVLAPQHQIETSSRVPQDPSSARMALAQAVARAYKHTSASAEPWARLRAALANDAKAEAAVAALQP